MDIIGEQEQGVESETAANFNQKITKFATNWLKGD
jgi:hypothetical protein